MKKSTSDHTTANFWRALPRPLRVLAPMEDITDAAFRRLLVECGRPDVFFSEFLSTSGFCSPGREAVSHRLQFGPEEHPVVAQLWGTRPEQFYETAQNIRSLGFDGIDINMGCPMPKIVRNGGCAALIENPGLAKEIFLATREGAGQLPVSIKTRLGYRRIETDEWAGFLLQLEPDALIVHGRFAKQLYGGSANWDEIAKVVALRNAAGSSTAVIGNGDVGSHTEMLQRWQSSGVDGVMIGRALLKNLFLFDPKAQPLSERSADEKLRLLLRHAELFTEVWGAEKSFSHMKRFIKTYTSSFDRASRLRVQLMETRSLEELRSLISSSGLLTTP